MRVTSNTFPENLIVHLQRLSGRTSKLQEQAATGQRVRDPSDDPAAAVRVLEYQSERARILQYHRNAQRASDIITATTAEVRNLVSISERANEVIALSSDIQGAETMRFYGIEVGALLEQALVNANANFNGEPLFGGTGSELRPFVAVRDAEGKITSVNYTGSATTAEFEVAEGSRISPYADHPTTQGVLAFLNNLVGLRDALASGVGSEVKAQSGALLESEDVLIGAVSAIGALQSRLDVEMARNSSLFSGLGAQISREADVDLAQVVVQLTQNQNAYQAALMSAGKVLNVSLLDYL
jgi:flagellar hook-associated protein 3 FlgL